MHMEEVQRAYRQDGFVVVRAFLPPEELAELRFHLDRYIREVVPGLPDSDAFYVDRSRPETLKQLQHMESDPFFASFGQRDRWREMARLLLGEDVENSSVEWFNKPPGTTSPTPPHQDNYYFSLKPPNVVTLWVALDRVDPANGCLRYVAGSHRHGVRPHGRSNTLGFSQTITDFGDADLALERPISLEPGDMVAHHGDTIHRAEANTTSDRHRRSFALVARGVSARRDEDAFARYLAALRSQHESLGLTT